MLTRLVLALLLSFLGACAPTQPLERFEFSRICMGVQARIVTYAPDRATASAAASDAYSTIAALDQCFSDYRPESELMRLCSQAGGPPVPISPDLLFILTSAADISEKTEGTFDITVGPAVRLWREARKSHTLPDAAALAQARSLIDWRTVHLDTTRSTAQIATPGVQLDLGGIAKGFAAQRAIAVMRERGLRRSLVALAGDIAIAEPPPGEPGWRISVAGEQGGASSMTEPFILANTCISTSGDTSQYFEIDGRRYSHIIDPRTGIGTAGGISATVIHPHGDVADAIPTALCILGPEAADRILARYPTAAAIIEWCDGDTVRHRIIDPMGTIYPRPH